MATLALVTTVFRLKDELRKQDPPMSQRELARRSGVSLVTVNLIANNETTRVDLATLDAFAKVLGCEPGQLLETKPRRKGAA